MQHAEYLRAMTQQRGIVGPGAAADLGEAATKVADLVRILGLPPIPTRLDRRFTQTQVWSRTQAAQERTGLAHILQTREQQQLEPLRERSSAEEAREHFQRRYAAFRRVLDAVMERARQQAEQEMWEYRPAEARVRLPPQPRVMEEAAALEGRQIRLTLALQAKEALEDERPDGDPRRADEAGATADELRLLRICAELGNAMGEVSFSDLVATVATQPAAEQE